MNLKKLLTQTQPVLTDGAMGTYFSALTGVDARLCEKYNLLSPDVIGEIHRAYLRAGAKLLRTNTFSANSFALSVSREELKQIITAGYRLAKECAGEQAVVCADCSVVYDVSLSEEELTEEYRLIADTFLACGAGTFLFETLPALEPALPAIDYILSVKPDAEIIVSFTLLPDGTTRSGHSVPALLEELERHRDKITMAGLNCGCGAAQLLPHAASFFSYIHAHLSLFTCVMPNAGYPTIENNRTVFSSAAGYFAEQTARLASCGVSAIGGCCGTTPDYIRLLGSLLTGADTPKKLIPPPDLKSQKAPFSSKLAKQSFVLAAELDPPNNSDISKLVTAARMLRQSGVDIITISDSPLGHARMDSVLCSARIKREADIEVLPHLCCRDKNMNALRSALLGAHSEGIRAVLAVTGDPIAETDRGVIKPVFNMDSTRLMQLVGRLNNEVFADAPICVGGAFDPAPRKLPHSLHRLEKKIASGAGCVLTQPVFSEDVIPALKAARDKGIKVLVGIMPMVSYRNASFMKNEVPGITIPDELVARFRPDMSREEASSVGITIATELALKMRPYADGFYFITPFNRAEIICSIIQNLKEQIPLLSE